MIFGTSIFIFLLAPIEHKIYNSNLIINSLRTIWEIGDEMGLAVKISLIIIFGLLVFAFKGILGMNRMTSYALSVIFAIISTTLVLAFLPTDFSRGYGIGLTGTRFDLRMVHIYIMGALLGGITFSYSFNKLSKNQ